MNAAERKRILAEADEFRAILAEFKAALSSWGPGVSFFPLTLENLKCEGRGKYVHITDIHMDGQAWRWLKPLLEELRDYRRDDPDIKLPPHGPEVAFEKYIKDLKAAAYAEWKKKRDAMRLLVEYPPEAKTKKVKKKKCKKHLPIDRKDSKGRPIKKCSYCCLVLKSKKKGRGR